MSSGGPIRIEDPADPRLADYVSLRDVNLRRSLESGHGLFIAEGEKVIRRAILAGYRPRSFLVAQRWLASLSDVLAELETPVYLVSDQLAERVTGFHVHRGALASMERVVRDDLDSVLSGRRLVVCEDIVDHTNLGAVLRSAAGLGWDGVLLSPRCADPLYRRSIKVSMGAVFSLPWARLPDWREAVPTLQSAGFVTIGLALGEPSVDLASLAAGLRATRPEAKIAILLGTEGDGLSDRWRLQADHLATIPMHAGIDSLNVAAAAAIACYALAGPM